MPHCKSGRHYWLNKDDAEKCCNGFRRCLDVVPSGSSTTIYYRSWEPCNHEDTLVYDCLKQETRCYQCSTRVS